MRAVIKTGKARTRPTELLARVEAGEQVTIARGDVPVARRVPVARIGEARAFHDHAGPPGRHGGSSIGDDRPSMARLPEHRSTGRSVRQRAYRQRLGLHDLDRPPRARSGG